MYRPAIQASVPSLMSSPAELRSRKKEAARSSRLSLVLPQDGRPLMIPPFRISPVRHLVDQKLPSAPRRRERDLLRPGGQELSQHAAAKLGLQVVRISQRIGRQPRAAAIHVRIPLLTEGVVRQIQDHLFHVRLVPPGRRTGRTGRRDPCRTFSQDGGSHSGQRQSAAAPDRLLPRLVDEGHHHPDHDREEDHQEDGRGAAPVA